MRSILDERDNGKGNAVAWYAYGRTQGLNKMRQHKPIIIFPRIAAWGEHRNEHQLATAQKMKELGYVYVATDVKELKELLTTRNLKPLHDLGDIASKSLIDELCKVIG